MIQYLLHASILLAGCFLFYWLLLRKETYYTLNRWLLLSILVLAIALPRIQIPQNWSLHTTNTIERVVVQLDRATEPSLTIVNEPTTESQVAQNSSSNNSTSKLSLTDIAVYIYLAGVILFAGAFLIQLLLLLYKKSKLEFIRDGDYKIYELTNNNPPFSFYRWIFINPTLYENTTYEQIIAHEKIHITQAHFIDKLAAELGIIVFWFNPFMWWLRSAIANNLEFITDNQMLDNGVASESYQMNLLQVSAPQYPIDITTSYNQSILQKRIVMMNQKKSSARSSWKYLTLIPALLFSIVNLNATYALPTDSEVTFQQVDEKERVHKEIISKELSFGSSSAENLLSIDNVTGAINVQGYNGNTIIVEIEKVIKADSDEELQRGIRETNVDIIDNRNEKHLYLDSPYSKFDTDSNEFSYKNNCGDAPCFKYRFQLHYTIKVPYNTNLRLSTINGGDIEVREIKGQKLVAKHISGSINLEDISGSTDAYTISGGITATYTSNPTEESSYVTTSGHIKVNYLEGLNANVTYDILDGDLLTEFDAIYQNKKNSKHGTKPRKSPIKIGTGDVDLFFKTTSGDVFVNKN